MNFQYRGFKIEQDRRSFDTRADRRQILPYIKSNDPPPGLQAGRGAGIAYDSITDRPYWSDGFAWFPFGTGAPGTVDSYGFIKDGDQTIPRAIDTTLVVWDTGSSPAYHTLSGWDLTTGIYTASEPQVLTLEVNISWEQNVSNLGNRILRVEFMQLGVPGWNIVKEVETQADPDIKAFTTQELQMHVKMATGDATRVTVEQDSPISIPVCGGVCTSIAGLMVKTV